MTFAELKKSILDKDYQPIYFLHGKEPYFLDELSRLFERNVLNETEKSFNETIVYGKDVKVSQILDICTRYPMMSDYQLVIVKEAQQLKELDKLTGYLNEPTKSTILVFVYKHTKLDLRTKIGKLIKAKAFMYESKPIYDNQIPDWIIENLKVSKIKIDSQAAVLLGEYLGTNLSKISHELDKIRLNVKPNETISTDHIEKFVGINKEFNVFELQDALSIKNRKKAFLIVKYFIANPKQNPFPMVISTLFSFFQKLYLSFQVATVANEIAFSNAIGYKARNQYAAKFFNQKYRSALKVYSRVQVEYFIGLVAIYDLKAKGVENGSASHESLLEELVLRILND